MTIDPITGPLSTQVTHYIVPGQGGSAPYMKVVDYVEVNAGDEGAVQLPHDAEGHWWRALNPPTAYEMEHEVPEAEFGELVRVSLEEHRQRVENARTELTGVGLSSPTVDLLLEGR